MELRQPHRRERQPLNSGQRSYKNLNRAALGILVAGLALPFLHSVVASTVPGIGPACFCRRLLDIQCPLCGMTRAMTALLTGRLSDALASHPLALLTACGLIAEIVYRVTASFRVFHEERLPSVLRMDALIHLTLCSAYAVYAVAFFLL